MERAPIKVVVVGDPETGKTSLIKQLVHGKFHPKYKGSTGVEFYLDEIHVREEVVRLQLWDIAGRDNRIGAIAKAYYKDAFGAMVVYDITRPSSFDTVADWKREIDAKVKLPNGQPLPVLLVGNKHDLETAQADGHQLDKFCQDHGFVTWFDVSAKTAYNVEEAVRHLTATIMDHADIFQQAHRQAVKFRRADAFDQKDNSIFCSPS